jgi:HlyD family secretion protein
MDIPRPQQANRRKYLYVATGLAVLALTTVAVGRLEPAAPRVDRAMIWTDTVKRGTMIRQVRGPGTLVPEQIRFIAAVTAGRVERVMVQPGAAVEAGTVLLELSNPEVARQTLEAQRQLTGAEAELVNLRAGLENQRLNQQASVAAVLSEAREAERQNEANEELARRGLLSQMELSRSRDRAVELETRLGIERQRLQFLQESMRAQLAAQQSQVERLRGLVDFQREQIASLQVRAGAAGVLRELPLQEGQWVNPGSNLAVVVQPGRLRAELRIPETQAKDVAVGQTAQIDTRNGIVAGRVVRIDPAVQNGTVRVDVALDGELPRGARPDLSVDGVIEIDRLENALYVGRPAYGRAESAIGIFKLNGASEAVRISARLGRSSVNTIEIIDGLREGDVVILSDMAQWDGVERVRLR